MRKIFWILIFSGNLNNTSAQAGKDSLLDVIHQSPNDTLKIIALTELIEHFSETNPDSSYYFSEHLLALSKQHRFKLNEVFALSQMGYGMLNLGNYPRSLQLILEALRLTEDPASEKNILPIGYLNKQEYLKQPVTARMQRLSAGAMMHQLMGVLYSNTNNPVKELEHYHKAIGLAEETGHTPNLITTYLTMGRVYLSLNKPDSAKINEQKAYDLSMRTGEKRYMGSILLNLARIEASMGNRAAAMEYARQAIEESNNQNYLRGTVASNLFLSDLFRETNNPDSNMIYARRALVTAEKLNSSSLLLRVYNTLAGFYGIHGPIDSTVKYQALVIHLNDSLFNTKQTQQFENIDSDEKQRRLEMANAKKDYEQRLQQYLLLGGLLGAMVFAFILFRSNKQRQRSNILLRKQKQEIERTLQELRNTQKQLVHTEKMASLGELTAGIAHEIQNPLNFVNNFSELNAELIADMRGELKAGKMEEALRTAGSIEDNEAKILEHGKRAGTIVRNMLQHSRSNSQKKEPTDLNELIREYLRLSFHGLKAKDKSFEAKMEMMMDPSLPKLTIVRQEIGRVILNLLNNAFYAVTEKKKTAYSAFEPTVSVTTGRAGDNVIMQIKDNGTGIDKKYIDKIFHPFFTTKPPGQGTGLGLSLSYDIIKAHGGEIKMEATNHQGTTFIITLPLR